jgi:hypothetical protein
MNNTALRTFLSAIALLGLVGAAQANLAQHIEYFDQVSVRIQDGSEVCGVKDPERYRSAIEKRLNEIGLQQSPQSLSDVYLFIWAKAFGPAKQQCAVFMSLRFGKELEAAAVRTEAMLDAEENLVTQTKTVTGTYPATWWYGAHLFVKLAPEVPDEVEKMGLDLVDAFHKEAENAQ